MCSSYLSGRPPGRPSGFLTRRLRWQFIIGGADLEDHFNFYWSTVSISLILVQGRPQHRLCVGMFRSLASGHSICHQVHEVEGSRLSPEPRASRALGLNRPNQPPADWCWRGWPVPVVPALRRAETGGIYRVQPSLFPTAFALGAGLVGRFGAKSTITPIQRVPARGESWWP